MGQNFIGGFELRSDRTLLTFQKKTLDALWGEAGQQRWEREDQYKAL